MTTKEELLNIFNDIKKEEIENDLKPESNEEESVFTFLFKESHYLFLNNITIVFNRLQLDDDNIHFYIDNEAVAAIAILNIEAISN